MYDIVLSRRTVSPLTRVLFWYSFSQHPLPSSTHIQFTFRVRALFYAVRSGIRSQYGGEYINSRANQNNDHHLHTVTVSHDMPKDLTKHRRDFMKSYEKASYRV